MTADRAQQPAGERCDCGGCREFRAITAEPRRQYYPPVLAEDAPSQPQQPARQLRRAV